MRRADLNLALVFAVVMDSGSVTAAAAKLYLTQPAISSALRRLRELTGRALFVRVGRNLAPTSDAHQLYSELKPALEQLQRGLFQRAAFDPAVDTRVFRIGLGDALGDVTAALIAHVYTNAPSLQLVFRTVDFHSVRGLIDSEQVDLAVSVADALPGYLVREQVGLSTFVCLFDPRKVKLPARPSMASYLRYGHVIVSYSGDLVGMYEDELKSSAGPRRIVAAVPRFTDLPAILRAAPLLAAVPDFLARRLVREHRLAMAPLPMSLRQYPMEMFWHSRHDADVAHQWLRSLVRETIAKRLVAVA
jgi:LysR family transcriptional activator of mexEF-oprN operon